MNRHMIHYLETKPYKYIIILILDFFKNKK